MKTIVINEVNLADAQTFVSQCVIALGFFDGVHLGHQEVIRIAREEANRRQLPLAVMSFKAHPMNTLSNGSSKVGNLMTVNSKKKKLIQLGVDVFYLVDFTHDFAKLSPKEFVQEYLLKLGVVHAVAGFDYCYGSKGSGKLNSIPEYTNGRITVTEISCVRFNSEKVSSTAIRQLLKEGRVQDIPSILGNFYTSKVYIDAQTMVSIENTMLPSAGCYQVVLKNYNLLIVAMIQVDESGKISSLSHFPKNFNGEMVIEWVVNMNQVISDIKNIV